MTVAKILYRDAEAERRFASMAGGRVITAANDLRTSELRPRRVPAKEPLVAPRGAEHRIVVKFVDALRARAVAEGDLSVVAAVAQDELENVVAEHGLAFIRAHTAADERLERLRERAAQRSGTEQPDLRGMMVAVPVDATRDGVWRAAQALHALPQVEFVALESLDAPPPPPAHDIAPTTEPLVGYQSYRTDAGLNFDYAWTLFGARGAGVQVIDCEYAYNASHEDLQTLVTPQDDVWTYYTGYGKHHGSAALGILAAGDNEYGMTGAVPDADVRFFPEHATVDGYFQGRMASIAAAVAASEAGDVVLLEMQGYGPGGMEGGPAEYDIGVWSVVKTATDAGVIVVAAVGNGGQDMDHPDYGAYHGRGNSGAILVGAGDMQQGAYSFSNYGTRVDVQAWGADVATIGYGNLRLYGGDPDQAYAVGFNGTSSASALVAAAAALTQSVALARLQRPLTPLEMRELLVETGRPQTGDLSRAIGPMPDLAAALPELLVRHKPELTSLEAFGCYYLDTAVPAVDDDPDGDGLCNLMEYFLGTNPALAGRDETTRQPRIVMTPAPPTAQTSGVVFQFERNPAATDVTWRIEFSDTLSGTWQTATDGAGGVEIAEDGETVSAFFPREPGATRFFARLVLTPE